MGDLNPPNPPSGYATAMYSVKSMGPNDEPGGTLTAMAEIAESDCPNLTNDYENKDMTVSSLKPSQSFLNGRVT